MNLQLRFCLKMTYKRYAINQQKTKCYILFNQTSSFNQALVYRRFALNTACCKSPMTQQFKLLEHEYVVLSCPYSKARCRKYEKQTRIIQWHCHTPEGAKQPSVMVETNFASVSEWIMRLRVNDGVVWTNKQNHVQVLRSTMSKFTYNYFCTVCCLRHGTLNNSLTKIMYGR